MLLKTRCSEIFLIASKYCTQDPEVHDNSICGHYMSSCFYLKQCFGDWTLYLCLGKKRTQLGPIDRASPYLQTHFLLGAKHYD
jgi:hypothetical protein